MEPERDIEKELKAYAQQRRAAGGTPPPLHPANRKALQAEAARLAKSPAARSRSWWQSLLGSWPRLAIAGAAAVAVVIVSMHLLSPPETEHERIASFATAPKPAEELKLTAAPAPASAPAPMPAQPMVLAEKSRAEGTSSTAALDNAANREPEVTATPAAVAQAPAPIFAAPARMAPATSRTAPLAATTPAPAPAALALNTPESRDRFSLSSSGRLAKDVNGLAPPTGGENGGAIGGASASFGEGTTADTSSASVTQRFYRLNLPAKAAKPFGVSNLLASFKVEQDLGKLRVIDGDGSVYFGFVEQTPESSKLTDGLFEKKLSEKETAQTKSARPLQAFHFRVSGTNRTLNEEIVFTGNFLTTATPQPTFATNAIADVAPATVAPGAQAQPVLFELQKARMEGQLLLGGTNKLEIKAAPVKR